MIGNIYAFEESPNIEWAVILQNKDDANLYFIVPLDQFLMVGSWDLPTTMGTLRCSRGIWVRGNNFNSYQGTLPTTDLICAVSKFCCTDSASGLEHIDDDPDYQEWLDHLNQVAHKVEEINR